VFLVGAVVYWDSTHLSGPLICTCLVIPGQSSAEGSKKCHRLGAKNGIVRETSPKREGILTNEVLGVLALPKG
jgi:hypothetical protein